MFHNLIKNKISLLRFCTPLFLITTIQPSFAEPININKKKSNSRVYSWGESTFFQTGHGNTKPIPSPNIIKSISNIDVSMISAGGQFSILLTRNGKIYSFGGGKDFKLGNGSEDNESIPRVIDFFHNQKFKMIDCGESHMGAITEDGKVYTWGKSYYNQLGHPFFKYPKVVESLKDVKIKLISCGRDHTIVCSEDGKVYSCGGGNSGALGHGNRDNVSIFKKIKSLSEKNIISIAAGEDFSLFLTDDHKVYSCGASDFGQNGCGQNERFIRTPKEISTLSRYKIKYISAKYFHAAAISEDGNLYMWGNNKTGQLGMGDDFIRTIPSEVLELNGIQVKSINCGGHHTAVLSEDGRVFMFGEGRSGQLGRGGNIESMAAYRDRPVEITNKFISDQCKVKQISLGYNHSVCLCELNDK